jgi:thioredoxin 1
MTLVYLDEQNFKKEVEQSEIPVIIDFWAEWCAPCRMMAPMFEQLSSEYEGRLKFAKLNTDEHPGIATRFNIQGIPALVISKQGKEVDRIVGFGPKDVIKTRIDDIMGQID